MSATVTERPTALSGIGVGRGLVAAPAFVLGAAPEPPADEAVPEGAVAVAAAAQHVDETLDTVVDELATAASAAVEPLASVLEATAMMADDPSLRADIRSRIEGGAPPLTAAAAAFDAVIEQFAALGGYLGERATDLRGVRGRLLAHLLGRPDSAAVLTGRSVLVASDLSPAETAQLDLALVAGIVLDEGGPTGHTAIIARQLGIPCVVKATGALGIASGTTVLIDAGAGRVLVDPDAEALAAVDRAAALETELLADTAPGATADGHPVALLANIGTLDDARRAAESAAEGVGLFRTEVLFLGRADAPGLDEQAALYTEVAGLFGARKLVVRTLDAGSDKPLAFVQQAEEENPALGVRGYRLARTAPELVETQISALGRAASGAVAPEGFQVMAPMIATVDEAAEFAARARAAGIRTVGVMVELPAAALRARDLLAEVDFVSLGTNDLAQYTMGADRLRGELAELLSPWQPAVLALTAATAEAGREADKPVGVCGESAADPLMALVLAGLGVTSLSMAPSALPAVRFALRRHTLDACRALAASALAARTADDARAAVLAALDPEVRTVLAL